MKLLGKGYTPTVLTLDALYQWRLRLERELLNVSDLWEGDLISDAIKAADEKISDCKMAIISENTRRAFAAAGEVNDANGLLRDAVYYAERQPPLANECFRRARSKLSRLEADLMLW